MDAYASRADGLHLQEAVPGWLLKCLRERPPGAARPSDCDGRWRELRRLFDRHLERFGLWVYRLREGGAWALGLDLAEKEQVRGRPAAAPPPRESRATAAGSPPPPPSHRRATAAQLSGESADFARLLWWDGDGGFLEAMHADDAGLRGAMEHIAVNITRHDSWEVHRRERRSSERAPRGFGEPPAGTLCDRFEGWSKECPASGAETCEAFVAAGTSCATFCAQNGAFCSASWDDADGGCGKREGGDPSCDVVRRSQICSCVSSCRDAGPWGCFEEGCPDRTVPCEVLVPVCDVAFGRVWRRAPPGMAQVLVRQACPESCGVC